MKFPSPWLQLFMPGKLHSAELEDEEKYLTPFAENFWGGHNVNDIYDAFSFAETGSFDNPWIRTTASETEGGSTAYGPVQVTGGLLTDYLNNEPDVYNNNKEIADLLREQASLFNYYGNEENIPLHPTHTQGFWNKPLLRHMGALYPTGIQDDFDYGGTGFNLTDIQKGQYKDLTQDMMLDMWDKNKNKDNPIKSFIQSWRGVPEDEDPDYYKRFNTYLGR